ncbi:MAG: VanW family protein [Firmicutes bacterium]|nr:VanW family protein [Bacillota bacterium]
MFIVLDLSKRNIILAIFVVFACLVIGSLTGYLTYDFLRTDVFDGVYLDNLHLGRLSKQAARQRIEEYLAPRLKEPIHLVVDDQVYTYTPQALGLSFNYEAITELAFQAGRRGNWWQQRAARQRILKSGLRITPIFQWNDNQLQKALVTLGKKVERRPVSARWEVSSGKQVKLVPALSGRKIAVDELKAKLESVLTDDPPYEIDLPFVIVKPQLDTEEAANLGVEEVISSFQTYFNPENTGRVKNITLAAQAIDGKILLPGETFSFNRCVGPRIPESGYEEAPIIVNGELVPGIGGGVCQVSTTLYNAAVLADLGILERNHHSLPSAYVELGRDATVFYDYLDLKLHNQSAQPVVIDAEVKDNYIEVRLLGKWVYDWRVQVEVEKLETIPPEWKEEPDPSLEPGDRRVVKEAMPGSKVRVWKKYVGPQGLISREILSVDTYQPINGVVKIPADSYLATN